MPAMLQAVYTRGACRVAITYHEDGECFFTVLGADPTDAELLALAEAGGSDVAGWVCEIR